MNLDTFHRVMAAGGVKPTLASNPEAQRQLITTNENQQQPLNLPGQP
jgi:hypothetical protein